MIKKVSENISEVISFETGAAALVQFSTRRENYSNDIQKISYKGSKQGISIRFWGKDNNLPHYREQLVSDNNIVGPLAQTKRDLTYGTGLFAYKKKFVSDGGQTNIEEVRMPADAKDFFDRNNIDDYILDALKSFYLHANIFTEFTRTREGKIDRIVNHDCKYVRLGEQNSVGKILTAYISGSWAVKELAKDGPTEYDREIFDVPLYNPEAKKDQPQFLLHTGDRFLNDGYYNSPAWFGSREWIELANAVPAWHISNINNGYTIRFHIQVPSGYFDVRPDSDTPQALEHAKKATADKKQQFTNDVNKLLKGVDGTGRALFSTYETTGVLGKKWPGIIIEPINVDIKDKAMLELFEKTNTANISSQGIHPVLANIETAGKLSSGSEIRNAYIMYLAIKTPIPRMIVLKAINLVKKINGWDEDIHFGFGDTEITTLDDNPTGQNKDVAVSPDTSKAAE